MISRSFGTKLDLKCQHSVSIFWSWKILQFRIIPTLITHFEFTSVWRVILDNAPDLGEELIGQFGLKDFMIAAIPYLSSLKQQWIDCVFAEFQILCHEIDVAPMETNVFLWSKDRFRWRDPDLNWDCVSLLHFGRPWYEARYDNNCPFVMIIENIMHWERIEWLRLNICTSRVVASFGGSMPFGIYGGNVSEMAQMNRSCRPFDTITSSYLSIWRILMRGWSSSIFEMQFFNWKQKDPLDPL